MLSLKVERLGDRVAIVLDDQALSALNVRVGDVLHLQPASEGVAVVSAWEVSAEDHHARGRAFLKRYNRAFEL